MLGNVQGINGVVQSIPRRRFVLLIRVTAFFEVFKGYLTIFVGIAFTDHISGTVIKSEPSAGERCFRLAVLFDDDDLCAEAAVSHSDLDRLTAGYQRDRIPCIVQNIPVEGIYFLIAVIPKRHVREVYIPVIACCTVSDGLAC